MEAYALTEYSLWLDSLLLAAQGFWNSPLSDKLSSQTSICWQSLCHLFSEWVFQPRRHVDDYSEHDRQDCGVLYPQASESRLDHNASKHEPERLTSPQSHDPYTLQ